MPPLSAELAGLAVVVVGLLVFALITDPKARATRRRNRVRRHAAAGCSPCRTELARLTRSARPAGGKGARR